MQRSWQQGLRTLLRLYNNHTGEWRDGLQHGQGTCEYTGGLRYEGEWRSGVRCGRGALTAQVTQYLRCAHTVSVDAFCCIVALKTQSTFSC
jgi:MORN repeat